MSFKKIKQSEEQNQLDSYDLFQKPSKIHRINNGKHKKQQRAQYMRLCKWQEMSEKNAKFLNNFNFKKTTAFKRMYSCGGYGGKCSMCSNQAWGKSSVVKETVIYKDSKLSFNLADNIILY